MKTLTTQEVHALFLTNKALHKRYFKFRSIAVRPSTVGEVVVTVFLNKDGSFEKETQNTVGPDDVAVINIPTKSNEEYVMPVTTLKKRYVPSAELWKGLPVYLPIGEVDGFEYMGEDIEFIAPWNELMILKDGDMLVDSNCGNGELNIYRIRFQEFKDTYKLRIVI